MDLSKKFLSGVAVSIQFEDTNGLIKKINLSDAETIVNEKEIEVHYMGKNYILSFERNEMYSYSYDDNEEIADKEYINIETISIY